MKIVCVALSAMLLILAFSVVQAEDMLNGAGATFPAPIYQAWAYDYAKTSGVTVNYQLIGSGGGIQQITGRTVDFGASDDPVKPEDLKKNNLIQFPTVIGGVVPVVNIQGIKEDALKLDSKSLCMIYLGDIEYWDHPIIKKINPNLKLPHSAIRVVHRVDDSGTTAIYTNYLSETCTKWKDKVGEGKSVKWPIGIGGKGNDGVANYVKQTPDAIGYVEFAYAIQNKLTYTQLKNRAGNFVSPNLTAFEEAAETGNFDPSHDFFARLTNTPGKNSWPIAGATFILLAKEKRDANMKAVEFFDWAFKNGDAKAKEFIYVPLPKLLKDKIRAYWKAAGIG
ncbi:MAG: phosphate ABC transporter substrate-binding protein PstS [Dissulfurispiraceae bacterium]